MKISTNGGKIKAKVLLLTAPTNEMTMSKRGIEIARAPAEKDGREKESACYFFVKKKKKQKEMILTFREVNNTE